MPRNTTLSRSLWAFGATMLAVVASGQTPSFVGAAAYSVGNLATSVAAGDFNHDNRPDLAVTHGTGVSILLNDGSGGFLPATLIAFPGGTNPVSITAGNFNGDTNLDLAVVTQGNGMVAILLGNGNGTFSGAVSYPAGSNPKFVATGDFNGDHKLDLAIADSGFATGSGASILLNNGDGTFQAPLPVTAGTTSISLSVGDFNGDTKADLAVANLGSDNISILLGNGNGTFQPAVNINLDRPGLSVIPTTVLAVDLNMDNKIDLAFATPNVKEISVAIGNGNGTFAAPVHYVLDDPNFVNNNNMLVAADLNGGGWPDLILCNLSANHITRLHGPADGTFPFMQSYAAGPEPIAIAAADFNGDNQIDLAVADNSIPGVVSVLLNDAYGAMHAPPLYRSGYLPGAIAVGDLNNDGKLDVVTGTTFTPAPAGTGTGAAMLGDGGGGFGAPKIWSSLPVSAVALADFNGDHKLDLVETTPNPGNGSVGVLMGNGDGTFQTAVSYPAGTSPESVAAADLNNDNKPDIVVSNRGTNNVSVLINNGNGTFQPAVNYPVPNTGSPDSVVVADFSGDGKPDIAVAITGVNASIVSVLLGNGNGTFQGQIPLSIGFASPSQLSLVTADFNGDNKYDLAVCDGITLSILMSTGNGGFAAPVTYQLVGAGRAIFTTLAVGDFNGDSIPDLVATTRNGFTVLTGNGDGSFGVAATYAPFLGGAIAVGDLDGDTRPDLIAADSTEDSVTTDTVAVLLSSTARSVPVTITSVPAGIQVVVNGLTLCNTPCIVNAPWGGVMFLYVYPLQTLNSAPGVQYEFQSWSFGGDFDAEVRVPAMPVTFTANFTPTYQLAISASPTKGGTVTPATGSFFNPGSVQAITATPNPGYVFAGWTGNVAAANNPSTTVTMTAAQTVTANFTFAAARCDLNSDAQINVADVQTIVNQALGVFAALADLNHDGMINVADLQVMINLTLGFGTCPP